VTLDAGARLGPYEILSAVGAGGMGEVYRARDTRLVQRPPGGQFDVTPDGERFLVNLRPGDQVSDPVTLVQNWAAGRK
jgi:serine/threonine protein kinase